MMTNSQTMWLTDKKYQPDTGLFEYSFVSDEYWKRHHELPEATDSKVYNMVHKYAFKQMGYNTYEFLTDVDKELKEEFAQAGYTLVIVDLNWYR